MIKLTKVSKTYLGEYLLKDISWQMFPGEKIALIGANGTGKTTQLRIICGLDEHDSGEIFIDSSIKIGYLSQEPSVNINLTLDEEMKTIFKEVIDSEYLIKSLQEDISTIKEQELLDDKLKELEAAQEFFETKEGYSINTKIGQVLSGLGFKESDRKRLIKTFSGGWQMRISIAKLLLESPDLLLLDEPTNHLDIKAIEWLESYLKTYKCGYIIVSHDREFLDNTVSKIIAMDGACVKLYPTNYTGYLNIKDQLEEAQLQTYNQQQKKLVKEKAFIEKFRASAARSSQAKSREKQISKINLVYAPQKNKRVKFNFPVSIKSGEDVLKFNNLKKAYDNNVILENINLEVRLGDKIGLIGSNGSGKTTLLRIIMGLDKDFTGKVRQGYLVNPVYFNQHEARSLSGSETVFNELHNSAPTYTNEQVRSTLARFGITGENVFKTLNDLSGGEKARLALAKILMSGANLLLFDEPTNHLDIPAKEALENALEDFEGTVIAVSHDRKFFDNFANKIFEIDNKNINCYLGNYSYYKYKKEKDFCVTSNQQTTQKNQIKSKEIVDKSLYQKKHSPKSMEKQLTKIESEILTTEELINKVELDLSKEGFYQNAPEEFMRKSEDLDKLKQNLEKLYQDYYKLSSLIES